MSVLGSLLGLVCTARGRQAITPRKRFGWLTLSALAIGGTGIWLMHFLAMLGFSVVGSDVRYAVLPTIFSAVLAVVVVGIGLVVLGTGKMKWWRVLAGGLFAGLGVNVMHYTGMAAMRVDGTIGYDPKLVALSVLIAVVAATAALWFTVVARNLWLISGAALIMGVAVTAMHYVGMAAARVKLDSTHSAMSGVDVTTALPVIAGLSGIIVVILLYSALSAPIDEETRAEEDRQRSVTPDSFGSDSLWTPRTAAPASAGGAQSAQVAGAVRGGQPSAADWLGAGRGPASGGPAPTAAAPGPLNGPAWPGGAVTPAPNGTAPNGVGGPQGASSRWEALRQKPETAGPESSPWADGDEPARRRHASDPWS
ncbi:MHYT domain-containing protein [Cryptosporangium phraense]|uniref:MHYT domain-containing protein n=1 Tax=Cryptosporangium phraense TaxID=2593070 RepID=UPI00197B047D|nr:MHYT domain-containing protein [Cryptosporangium phraense]